jgi:hypothetical protein
MNDEPKPIWTEEHLDAMRVRPMPTYVEARSDADELWTAFQEYSPGASGGSNLRAFIAGWDANRSIS